MNLGCWLVFNRNGVDRMVKREPDLGRSEYAAHLILSVPDELFHRQPIPRVEVVLRTQQLTAADVIVDGEAQPGSVNADDATMKQIVVQRQFAQLLASAQESSDPAMQGWAKEALDALLDAGVEVRVVEEAVEGATD